MIRLLVKEIAQQKKISMGKLARRADLDKKTLQRIYRYPTLPISTETLDRLALALEVDAATLLRTVSLHEPQLHVEEEVTDEDEDDET